MGQLIYDKDKYIGIDYKKVITKVEDFIGSPVLWMNMTGKRIMGLYTNESDFDMKVIVSNSVYHNKSIELLEDNIDVYIRDVNTILAEYTKYNHQQIEYPSVLARTKGTQKNIPDYKRDDSYSVEIIESLGSDYIWDSGYLKNNVHLLLQQFKIIDILDYYFTRGWMILKNDINSNCIYAIKYIMCIKNLLFAQWCIEKQTVPCFDLLYNIKNIKNKTIGEYFVELIKNYKYYGKTYTVSSNLEVNKYLELEFEVLRKKMVSYSRTSDLKLGKDCYFSKNNM